MTEKEDLQTQAEDMGLQIDGLTSKQLKAAIANAEESAAAPSTAKTDAPDAAPTGKKGGRKRRPAAPSGVRSKETAGVQYTCISNVRAHGRTFNIGAQVQLSAIEAKPLLRDGAVELLV